MRHSVRMTILVAVLAAALLNFNASNAQTPETPKQATLLSAFFGLDDALPFAANAFCRGANRQDGMPVIFSAVIDGSTLDAKDFAVITKTGVVHTPICATLSPATDQGELRTVLLIGELGNAKDDPPVEVKIVGDILTSSGKGNNPNAADADWLNFKGASVDVTPLEAGPFLVVAENVPEDQWTLDRRSGRQQGDGCPSKGTVQIVRATWAGGISNAVGDEAGDIERKLYRVTVLNADGTQVEVIPFALADLGDGDNNHLLCLDVAGDPQAVSFPAGHLLDPNRDTLNPDASVNVTK